MAEPRNEETTDDQAINSETGSQQNADRDIMNDRISDEDQVRGGGDPNGPTDPDSPDAQVDRDDSATE